MNIEELDDLEFILKDIEKDQNGVSKKITTPTTNNSLIVNKTIEPKIIEGKYKLPVTTNSVGKVLDDETKPTIIGHFTMTGANPLTHKGGKHLGLDLQAPKGAPVYPIGSGIVIQIFNPENNKSGGNAVKIHHLPQDPDLTSYYAHFDSVNVSVGQKVNVNDILGSNGNSGSARHTSAHVHLQTSLKNVEIDPFKVIGKDYGFTNSRKDQPENEKIAKLVTASELYLRLCNK